MLREDEGREREGKDVGGERGKFHHIAQGGKTIITSKETMSAVCRGGNNKKTTERRG